VTIDHALRPGSAAEARYVAAFCATRDIPHKILRWDGEKPATGVSAAAREARYRLLASAAAETGAGVVLTGHTANDQAETIAMRRERGDGRGLAGIAPATLYDGAIWMVRPLLDQSRAALRTYLADAGIRWIDDPSNEKEEYERVRARKSLAGPDEDRIVAALLEQGRHAALERTDTGRRAADLIRGHGSQPAPGVVRLDAGFFQNGDAAAARLAFRFVLAAVGGREHLPEAKRARAAYERLATGPGRVALAGAVADRRKAAMFLHRETRAGWTGAAPAVPGALWDGRYRIAAARLPENAIVQSLGRTLAEARARTFDASVPPPLVRAALSAEPMIHVRTADDSLDRHSPGAGTADLKRVAAPFAHFLPSFDLEPARALAELVGADDFPPSPWDSHNAA
jgi:tRNA(Ile)-lysidine synthase